MFIDTYDVADVTLTRDEVMVNEGNPRRLQTPTQPRHHLVPKAWITGGMMSEMNNLADRRINVRHVSLRSHKGRRTGDAPPGFFRALLVLEELATCSRSRAPLTE